MHDNFSGSETATDDGAGEAGEPHECDSKAPTNNGVIIIAGKRYLTIPKFAKAIDRSERTVARWHAKGIGPPYIQIGNLRLIDEAKVPSWLESHETGSLPGRRRRPRRIA